MATGTTTVDFGTGKTDVSVAIALVHHKKARYNAAIQQQRDEEDLLLMF